MKKILFIITLSLTLLLIKDASAATLSISPGSGEYPAGQIFTTDILIDTQNQPIDGVDIHYLNYNPNQLEVQDDDASQPGIQITPANLMPLTQANSVDSKTGKITFSQITAGGNTFKSNDAQVLATIHFKVLQTANASVFFDFELGDTRDSNIASKGVDILTSVTNAAYGSAPAALGGDNNGNMTTVLIIFIALVAIAALSILLRIVLRSLKKEQNQI